MIHPYYHSRQKRAFDIVTALLLCVATIPLCLVICIVIFLTSGFPIIFKQKRMGKNKQPFTMYKFRTMHVGAEKKRGKFEKYNEAPSPMFKIENDPRFTGIGKWLSNYGLDELPQLFNILKGEMSIVGPRPLPLLEANKLDKNWDFRYLIRPGILSKWALSPRRHSSLKAWLQLEQAQLTNGSLSTDLLLAFQIGASLAMKALKNVLETRKTISLIVKEKN